MKSEFTKDEWERMAWQISNEDPINATGNYIISNMDDVVVGTRSEVREHMKQHQGEGGYFNISMGEDELRMGLKYVRRNTPGNPPAILVEKAKKKAAAIGKKVILIRMVNGKVVREEI